MPDSVAPVAAILGEGPVWIARDAALWFVDIKAPAIYRFDPATGAERHWPAPAQVSWVLPHSDGSLIVGLQSGLARFAPASGAFAFIGAVEPRLPYNRLNDATTDPHGRLWFGSMDDAETAPSGHIYRADARGIARMVSGISITNGPALSPDGRLLYHNDTLGRRVFVSHVGEDGVLHDSRVFAEIETGYPDGPTVDSEGGLWVALYAGWGVHHYDPGGRLVETIHFPVANVTKIAFGGADLRTAYATTASKGLSRSECAAQPLAGNLFAFDPCVAGQHTVPAAPFTIERRYD
ncbi:MAG: SMP-30/gluconolactonase/LRE family protein [Pseudomonadota bacterium]|nr:SMP-30/gluconolactonase/LRE family protein [Pseudomonadota bacterium]